MGSDIDELLRSLRAHGAGWSADQMRNAGLALVLADDAHRDRMAQARRVLVTEHLLTRFASVRRPLLVMKGLEVALLYPAPEQRPFRDLDVLVPDGRALWDAMVSLGFVQHPGRRIDIDHHHLPPLADPSNTIGIEIHSRPNVPRWATVPTELVLATAVPSRTGFAHVLRPRDDIHALLVALHCWKGGFTKRRDLFDALLLAAVSEVPVQRTADELGLGRFWRWTVRLAEWELFGEPARGVRAVARVVMPRRLGVADRNRTRVVAPYLVRPPWTVTAAHIADIRLGRAARREVTPPG